MAVNMLTVAFWVVMPCNLIDGYQHLRKMYCQHFKFLNSETAYSPEALVATYRLRAVTIHKSMIDEVEYVIEIYISVLYITCFTLYLAFHWNKNALRTYCFYFSSEANTKLQDTNDSLLTVMDMSGLRSPRPSSPCCCSHASSIGSSVGLPEGRKRKRYDH
jgi:hypothetical protein